MTRARATASTPTNRWQSAFEHRHKSDEETALLADRMVSAMEQYRNGSVFVLVLGQELSITSTSVGLRVLAFTEKRKNFEKLFSR